MYVCVCKAVSDRQIRRAVREEGVVSLRELTREFGLGTCCGKCVLAARQVLGEALQAAPAAVASASVMPNFESALAV